MDTIFSKNSTIFKALSKYKSKIYFDSKLLCRFWENSVARRLSANLPGVNNYVQDNFCRSRKSTQLSKIWNALNPDNMDDDTFFVLSLVAVFMICFAVVVRLIISIRNFQRKLNCSKNEVKDKDQKIKNLQNRIETGDAKRELELENAAKIIKDLETQLDDLTKESKTLKSDALKKLEEKIKSQEQQITKLKSDLAHNLKQHAILELEKNVSTELKNKQIKSLQESNRELEDKHEKLMISLKNSQQEFSELRQFVDECKLII
jgi:cell division protein FtsL